MSFVFLRWDLFGRDAVRGMFPGRIFLILTVSGLAGIRECCERRVIDDSHIVCFRRLMMGIACGGWGDFFGLRLAVLPGFVGMKRVCGGA